jgi:hypothetical protein
MSKLELPKLGDIVTWEDTYTGHGTFDGKVVSVDAKGVFVSRSPYGVGNGTRYALIPYERIVTMRTPQGA